MASLLRRLRADTSERSAPWPGLSLQDFFSYAGHQYNLHGTMQGSSPETPDPHFVGFVRGIHQRNGVVSAAVTARALLLSQLRFVWRNNRVSQTPGRTFGAANLAPLERPGSTTRSDLLYRLELDASYAGNAYGVRKGNTVTKLRPDFVSIVLGSNSDPDWDGDTLVPPSDAREIGIIYRPQGVGKQGRAEMFLPGEYFHWMPEPDPLEFWRGSSWVTSVMREITIDGQVTDHQSKFFENAATPNLVFIMDKDKTPTQVKDFADVINEKHAGTRNAYRNLFLGGGTDAKVVGSTLESLALKDVTGGLESRIASRSRVPAVVLGIREGMAGSALNSGNYGQTRRLWADGWFAPTTEGLCSTLEAIIPPPVDAELWPDRSQVLFLQEDEKDAAEIIGANAATIANLVKEGFDATSAIEAVLSGDLSKLKHSGLVSVQLQTPGATQQ